MANVELKPARVFEQFAKINAIPRPSKHEEKMIEYLKAFGQERGLETKVDETGNVIIRKPATPGMENKPCVILQSHMDMVCDKLVDVEIDFQNDPIQTYVDGEWLKAKRHHAGCRRRYRLRHRAGPAGQRRHRARSGGVCLHRR